VLEADTSLFIGRFIRPLEGATLCFLFHGHLVLVYAHLIEWISLPLHRAIREEALLVVVACGKLLL